VEVVSVGIAGVWLEADIVIIDGDFAKLKQKLRVSEDTCRMMLTFWPRIL
jgi:hypothetical protein